MTHKFEEQLEFIYMIIPKFGNFCIVSFCFVLSDKQILIKARKMCNFESKIEYSCLTMVFIKNVKRQKINKIFKSGIFNSSHARVSNCNCHQLVYEIHKSS